MIPEANRAKFVDIKDGDSIFSNQRVLGVLWDTTTNCFRFCLNLWKVLFICRGWLSVLSSVFDPLGFVAPLIPTARLFQDLCHRKYDWDDALLKENVWIWRRWLDDLNNLSAIAVRRCILPPDVDLVTLLKCQLHHFTDASSVGYSTVMYLRVVAQNGTTFCSFMMGKSRLVPLKPISIPRLELVAAAMATTVDTLLRCNLKNVVTDSIFWTHSMVVLHMINNSLKHFPVFISNCLAQIEEVSDPSQWWYVEGSRNPEDHRTRLANMLSHWLTGPSFLQETESHWPHPPCNLPDLPDEFKVSKRTVATSKVVQRDQSLVMEQCFSCCSSLKRLKCVVARILRLRNKLLQRPIAEGSLTVDEITLAESAIITAVQREAFLYDYSQSNKPEPLGKNINTTLRRLNPICVSGVLRVGDRLCRAPLDFHISNQSSYLQNLTSHAY